MARPLLRVVKVGGSLLTYDDLPAALRRWLAAQASGHDVLICGGGPLADAVRQIDGRHKLDAAEVHRRCLEVLSITARLLAQLLPGFPLTGDFGRLRDRLATPGATLFDVREFIETSEPTLQGTPLPAGWEVTSDAIAARVAQVLKGDVYLLKSSPPPSDSLAEATAAGYVDKFLPRVTPLAGNLFAVDLRGDQAPIRLV